MLSHPFPPRRTKGWGTGDCLAGEYVRVGRFRSPRRPGQETGGTIFEHAMPTKKLPVAGSFLLHSTFIANFYY